MTGDSQLGGIVLAGGRSTRMGTPKPLIDWHGTPLVARVAGLVGRAASPVVVVVASDAELPPLPAGVRVAADAHPGQGPLEGLAAGLRALSGEAAAAYATGADVPFLDPRLISRIAGALGDADAAVAVGEGRNHYLAAVYRLSLLPLVEELLRSGERRLGALAERAAARRVEVSGPAELASLRNLNTPADLDAARAAPPPGVTLEGVAPAPIAVQAASLRQLIAVIPLGEGGFTAAREISLNGRPVRQLDDVPLVDGDRVTLGQAYLGGA